MPVGRLPVTPRQVATTLPPEARGKIGEAASALGFGTKAEENIDGSRSYWEAYPRDRLLPLPVQTDPSWSADEIEQLRQASEMAAAAGDNSVANLWRANLARPKGRYVDVAGLVRMAQGIANTAAGRRGERPPCEPRVLLTSIADLQLNGATHLRNIVPLVIQDAVIGKLNDLLRRMARAGYAGREEIRGNNAPMEVSALSVQYSSITGGLTRVVNQIGHLQTISRLGQTAHMPMTLGRRIMLVNSALVQLADDVEVLPWTAQGLGLVTPAVRTAWARRLEADPLPAPRHKDLFAWADRDKPSPAELDDPDLDRLIQQHPDMGYVEALRAERRARSENSAQA